MAFLCLETANRVDQVDLKAVLATVPTRNVLGVLEALALTLSLMVVLPVVLTLAPLVRTLNLRPDLLVVPVLLLTLNLSFGVEVLDSRPTLAFMAGFLALTLRLILAFLVGFFFIAWSLLVGSLAAPLTNLASRLEMSFPIGETVLETDQNMAEILFMAPWVKVVLHLVIESIVQQAEVIDGHILVAPLEKVLTGPATIPKAAACGHLPMTAAGLAAVAVFPLILRFT